MLNVIVGAAAGAIFGGLISYFVSKQLARSAELLQRELALQSSEEVRWAAQQARKVSENHDRLLRELERERADFTSFLNDRREEVMRLLSDRREEFLQQLAMNRERFEEDTLRRRDMLTFLGRIREFAAEVLNHTLPDAIAEAGDDSIVDQLEHQLGTLTKRLRFEREYEISHEVSDVVYRELGDYLGFLRRFRRGECTVDQMHSRRLTARDRINDVLWRVEDVR